MRAVREDDLDKSVAVHRRRPLRAAVGDVGDLRSRGSGGVPVQDADARRVLCRRIAAPHHDPALRAGIIRDRPVRDARFQIALHRFQLAAQLRLFGQVRQHRVVASAA